MASTVLPNGIIIPEKYSRDWYNDLYHNWQELDNLLGGGTPKDGTLTIQKNGTTVGTFSANQATNETINITVPTVNDATLTIQQNGTTVDTFTANSSTDKTVNITVPIKTSDLTNDSNFVPSTDLATVATSGSYNDLSNKPTIPTVNDATLTIQKNGTTVKTFTANASSNVTADITVPSKTSDLTNDSGFITSDTTKIPLAGTSALAGSIVPSTDNAYDLGDSTYGFKGIYTNKIYLKDSTIFKLVDDNFICISGATAQANGANIVLNGKNRSTSAGEFKLEARDGTNTSQLIGKPNGNLSWSGRRISSNSNSDELNIDGGAGYALGATLWLTGKNHSVYSGYFTLIAHNGTNECQFSGTPSGTLLWTGNVIRPNKNGGTTLGTGSICFGQIYSTNSAISTSDERQKDNIKQIDDKLLQAWGNVNIVQFNFKDALEKKGANARLHTGYIAQNIQQACEENGVNPNDYGLFCHDSWEEQEEKKDENGQVIEPYRAKGDLYSLRYEEALIVECAYLRKKLKELTDRIEQLKKGNNTK